MFWGSLLTIGMALAVPRMPWTYQHHHACHKQSFDARMVSTARRAWCMAAPCPVSHGSCPRFCLQVGFVRRNMFNALFISWLSAGRVVLALHSITVGLRMTPGRAELGSEHLCSQSQGRRHHPGMEWRFQGEVGRERMEDCRHTRLQWCQVCSIVLVFLPLISIIYSLRLYDLDCFGWHETDWAPDQRMCLASFIVFFLKFLSGACSPGADWRDSQIIKNSQSSLCAFFVQHCLLWPHGAVRHFKRADQIEFKESWNVFFTSWPIGVALRPNSIMKGHIRSYKII